MELKNVWRKESVTVDDISNIELEFNSKDENQDNNKTDEDGGTEKFCTPMLWLLMAVSVILVLYCSVIGVLYLTDNLGFNNRVEITPGEAQWAQWSMCSAEGRRSRSRIYCAGQETCDVEFGHCSPSSTCSILNVLLTINSIFFPVGWSAWSMCTNQCGEGTQTRKWECQDSNQCENYDEDIRNCSSYKLCHLGKHCIFFQIADHGVQGC